MEVVNFLSRIFVFVVCASCVNASITAVETRMAVGIMQRTNTQTLVVEETTSIPFITKSMNPDFGFGYKVEFSNDKSHLHKVIIHIPGNAVLTGVVPTNINNSISFNALSVKSL